LYVCLSPPLPHRADAAAVAAVTDPLQITHWERDDNARNAADYPFAKFNRRIDVVRYDGTDAEYERACVAEGWTRGETDRLLDLCERFDLRFPIVTDRFNAGEDGCGYAVAPRATRTEEELKDRYYTMSRAVLLARCATVQESAAVRSTNNVFRAEYDRAHEEKRKERYNSLYRRSQAQLEGERLIWTELTRLEHLRKRLEKEERQAKRAQRRAERTARGQGGSAADAAATPAAVGRGARLAAKARRGPVIAAAPPVVLAHAASGPAAVSRPGRPSLASAAFLAPITGVPVRVARKVDASLESLDLGLLPMPTAEVTRRFVELRQLIAQQLEVGRQVDKVAAETRALQEKKTALAAIADKMAQVGVRRAEGGGGANKRMKTG
jgi:DNA methyltransferase 1-associated protein 1